jgi:hypothetical protein
VFDTVSQRRATLFLPIKPLKDSYPYPGYPPGFSEGLQLIIRFVQDETQEHRVKRTFRRDRLAWCLPEPCLGYVVPGRLQPWPDWRLSKTRAEIASRATSTGGRLLPVAA